MRMLTLVTAIFVFAASVLAQQAQLKSNTGNSASQLPPATAQTAKKTPEAATQQPPQTTGATSTPQAIRHPQDYVFHPARYAVAFLPLVPGDKGFAFLVSPDGKAVRLPMAQLKEAFRSGYRPFTVADWLAITNAVAQEEANWQRRYKELSEDYDALAARYNRLAEINATPRVQPQPVIDYRRAEKAMLFRTLLQRAFPAAPTRVNVRMMDCTKFPALCAGQ